MELLQKGFNQSKNDYSLFIRDCGKDFIVIVVYVDDIVITGNNEDAIKDLKLHLHHIFSIKDLGHLNCFLGIEVSYVTEGIILTQQKFTKEILAECGFDISKRTKTPLPANVKLLNDEGEVYSDPSHYRCLIGKLNFLTHTRPDLSFSVQTLSQFLQQPRLPHVQALTHVLRYLNHTSGQGILLQAAPQLTLHAYSDSDWASCPNTRRSIAGYVMLLGQSPISWKSKKQSTVSRSSSQAEYRAMAAASSEITWLVRLLQELGIKDLLPIALKCDNQSAIQIGKNQLLHERTKHVELDCHFTRDKVMEGLIELLYTPSQEQLADLFTKALPSPQHNHLLSKLGIHDTHTP